MAHTSIVMSLLLFSLSRSQFVVELSKNNMSVAQPRPHDDAKIVFIFETAKRKVEKVSFTNFFGLRRYIPPE